MIGYGAKANTGASNAIVTGTSAVVETGVTNAIASGTSADVAANNGIATGNGAYVASTGTNGVASGANASVYGSNGVALGTNATVLASASNSVALGNGSVADAPNTVSVGTVSSPRRIVNVANGVLGNDAVNVNQLNTAIRGVQKGIATSMAMASTITPSAPGKTTVGFNGATYAGFYSAAINFAHRVNSEAPIYVSGAVGAGEDGSWGGRVGVAVEF